MCRWLAYSGDPILINLLLYRPKHSLIDQSRHSEMGAETTNGDGFGIGWYTDQPTPGTFRGIGPAWSSENLHDVAEHVHSPLFFAHVRASTGTDVQETNCHPFRHDRWLWMHNGGIKDFALIKRELAFQVDPDLYPSIRGTTDTEMMFFLALTLGLRDDPVGAVQRMVGLVEQNAERKGIENPMQMTVATSDGETMWVFRYSTQHQSRTLFYSTEAATLKALHPEVEALQFISDDARLVVSEPVGALPYVWKEVPESTYSIIRRGEDHMADFVPERPR